MTTPNDAAPATDEAPPVEPTEPVDQPDTPDTPESDPPESPNHEAARFRVQLRAAETKISDLEERLAGYQRAQCESAVADLLDEAADLWDIGQADLADFYDDDGTLDEAELQAAAGALIEQRPRLAKPQGPRHHNFGQYAAQPPPSSAGWGELLK